MLRKKEKKAITSIIALLIGWPVGLDQFLEGNSGNGFKIIIGWSVTGVCLLSGFGFLGSDLAGFGLLWGGIGVVVGSFLFFRKLVKKLKAFEEAED